jgi:hypothetical protein
MFREQLFVPSSGSCLSHLHGLVCPIFRVLPKTLKMGQTSVPETLVIHQKFTPGYNPRTFKQHDKVYLRHHNLLNYRKDLFKIDIFRKLIIVVIIVIIIIIVMTILF